MQLLKARSGIQNLNPSPSDFRAHTPNDYAVREELNVITDKALPSRDLLLGV